MQFSQIIDFIISYRSYLITHLKLNRLEIILAEQLQIDASYYKAAVEYMCYMVPSESDSPLLHRWESCERIVHLLLTAREARVKSHGTSESTLEYRDAAVLDLAVKLLFKLHPVTQEGRKDARSTAERRAAIDAVIDMYPNLSKACCSPDADSAEVLSIFGQRTETVRVTPDEKLMYFELPISRDKVVIVNDMDSVTFAAACLLNRDRIDIIGIDTEWRPMRNSGAFNKCSVLQIACRSNVFLFDLMVLEPTFADFNFDEVSQTIRCFRELIQSLLASDTVLKLGKDVTYYISNLIVSSGCSNI